MCILYITSTIYIYISSIGDSYTTSEGAYAAWQYDQ